MIVINSLPPITLYNASMKFYHAAKLIDENAGRVMAEVMEEWAYEFLDMMKMLAEAGGIPANPALSTWTLALSNGKQYTYDTGEFWASMEVRTRHLKNWAEVTIKPTGYSSHSFGPRRSHLFPM
ncbi:MAG: hypothetical protein PHZ19_08525, partial [Candidatus Thermoplasmatota archaeon]|nr:hypothetical protein [Candidatus Thermoplasmatota archaeon]